MNIKEFWQEKKYFFVLLIIVLFGFFLRLKGYLINPSFWHDECGLAWNIKFKTYPELFGILNFLQVTPPLFLVLTKLLTKLFGFSELVFRLIPLVSGCSSIIAFYFLAKKVLNKNLNILLAVFFFAINSNLINYSFEFKPYSLDVLLTILCLLLFINLDINKLSRKKVLFYGILLAILPWFSFVSVFIIAGGLLFKVIRVGNDRGKINGKWKMENGKLPIHLFPFRNFLALSIPLIISLLIYVKFYVIANYTGTTMPQGWQNYFINNIGQFLELLIGNIKYLFSPVKFVLFTLIFMLWGLVLLLKEKSRFLFISLTSFLLLILASCLHLYPFGERLVLFLIPIFLLLMFKPLDLISLNNKLKSGFIILLFFLTFYPQFIQTKDFLIFKQVDREEYAREMMDFMMKKIEPNDIIFVNSPSEPEFAYYYSFYSKKNQIIQENFENLKKLNYLKKLNGLKSGYYWFYLPIDYLNIPVFPWIEGWAKDKNIIFYQKTGKKYHGLLMYVQIK
ncbi:MAG: glycosyltransferase family 39 protein [Candidatus Gastranaerophilales bacterium]|nr:glycosyltransferase family 39 protein [Candidatus Gastranaerophilales bacterium]